MTGFDLILPLFLGLVTGFLSSCGLGGGTLLLLYLVEFTTLSQTEAQGINLLFFIPTAVLAVSAHKRSGLIEKEVTHKAITGGLVGVLCGTLLSSFFPMDYLRKGFSLLLLFLGSYTLYSCKNPPQNR